MADISRGPVPTLPGQFSPAPSGYKCDKHPDRPAVRRVQGETDSFGCEYYDLCRACLEQYLKSAKEADYSGKCDWCKKHSDHLYPHRDIEEGMCGRVYEVCNPCIDAEREQWREEDEYDCE